MCSQKVRQGAGRKAYYLAFSGLVHWVGGGGLFVCTMRAKTERGAVEREKAVVLFALGNFGVQGATIGCMIHCTVVIRVFRVTDEVSDSSCEAITVYCRRLEAMQTHPQGGFCFRTREPSPANETYQLPLSFSWEHAIDDGLLRAEEHIDYYLSDLKRCCAT
jgi:hypothetical protein